MPRTPYFLVDEQRLVANLSIVRRVREESGAKSVLALKCFSTWSVFGVMREHLDGTTSSSVYEARLGREEFGGEVHAYSVAFTADEVAEVGAIADKVIFNSFSQLDRFGADVRRADV
ncbi:MAG: carboxynorspermidine decarboxylase, partial [Ilumatobacteraceae bacterium]